MVTLRDAERLVGMPYVAGRFTCMHLAVWAQKELFGREVAQRLPPRTPLRGRGQAQLLEAWRHQLADPVNVPVSGDLALFEDESSEWRWHIATVFMEAVEVWVLHTHQGIGSSVLERLRETPTRGLKLEGFYRWR